MPVLVSHSDCIAIQGEPGRILVDKRLGVFRRLVMSVGVRNRNRWRREGDDQSEDGRQQADRRMHLTKLSASRNFIYRTVYLHAWRSRKTLAMSAAVAATVANGSSSILGLSGQG